MEDKELIKLLSVINKDSNLDMLIREGYSYVSILHRIKELKKMGLVITDSSKVILTSKGFKLLSTLNKQYNYNSNKGILHLDEFRIDKIGIFDIYLSRNTN